MPNKSFAENHIPVLLKEVMEFLDVRKGDVYLDATLGEGGHALEVWTKFGRGVEIAGIDLDSKAVEAAKERLGRKGLSPKFGVLNFRNIDKAPEILGISRPNRILFDLGWSKSQFEKSGRGFSFKKDEPLLMTFEKNSEKCELTAFNIINFWEQENIETILRVYGEEKFAARIAKEIVEARKIGPIKNTFQLVEIIERATPAWYHRKKIHPATRTFQALRITVNDELAALKEGLPKAMEILREDGRLAVISFHSLEDRIVKELFKTFRKQGGVEILTKKPVKANRGEVTENPRSRRAKLRVIKKTTDNKYGS